MANWIKVPYATSGKPLLLNMDHATYVTANSQGGVTVCFGEGKSNSLFGIDVDIDTLALLLDAKDMAA